MVSITPRRVPVTVVCDWWGDGPSVVVGRLAAAVPGLAVLRSSFSSGMNELAATGTEVVVVEAEVAYRAADCPCCAVRVDIVTALSVLARRRHPPRHIVVESLGDADAATIAQTLLDHPVLRSLVTLDGIVTVLDGPRVAAATAGGGPTWPTPAALDQVLLADRIVVHGTDRLTERGLALAGWTARGVNPTAPIELDGGVVDATVLLGLRAWELARVPERLGRSRGVNHRPDRHPAGVTTTTRPLVLDAVGALDAELVQGWMENLHYHAGRRLLRLDAALSFDGDERTWLATGVRTTLVAGRGPAQPDGDRDNRIRLVGHDLDADGLAAGLAACVAR